MKRARHRVGADTTVKTGGAGDLEPKGRRARELLAFIRAEIGRTGTFPTEAAMMGAMRWKCGASVEDALLRLLAGGFISREIIARRFTRRVYLYRLCKWGAPAPVLEEVSR